MEYNNNADNADRADFRRFFLNKKSAKIRPIRIIRVPILSKYYAGVSTLRLRRVLNISTTSLSFKKFKSIKLVETKRFIS